MAKKKKLEMVIKADPNDADYIYRTSDISEEDLKRFAPIFKAIKKRTKEIEEGGGSGRGIYNWPEHERAREENTLQDIYKDIDPDLLEEFRDYVPSDEYGVHTIESIFVYEKPKKKEMI